MTAVSVPIEHVLVLAAALFTIGLVGVLVRRNVIFLLMSLGNHDERLRAGLHCRRRPLGGG